MAVTINGLEVPARAAHLERRAKAGLTSGAVQLLAAQVDGQLALVLLTETGVRVVTSEAAHDWRYSEVQYVPAERDLSGTLEVGGRPHPISWDSRRDGRAFRKTFEFRASRPAPEPSVPDRASVEKKDSPMVRADHLTTLADLPGFRVVRNHGVVTAVASDSAWTATQKGNAALDLAATQLRVAAASTGANAVLGLQVATFGAAGGITTVVGGDAVGVLLMGTAVTVERLDV